MTTTVKREGARAARSKTMERLGRAGYAAMGVVWLLVGGLALAAAFGKTSEPDSTKDALARISDSPLGRAVLVAVGVGLLGFALWRFAEALFDPEHAGRREAKHVVVRAAKAGLGVIYTSLGVWALSLGLHRAQSSSTGDKAPGITARVMELPAGTIMVGLIGLGMIAYAIGEAVYAVQRRFLRKLDVGRLDAARQKLVERSGLAGLLARSVVWAIVGTFLIVAAKQHDPSEAKGLGGALTTLKEQAWGPWLLAAVAIGLAAFGVYDLMKSRYRRFTATA